MSLDVPLTIVIPVGPEKHHRRWLRECLESIDVQSEPVDEVLIVDDMAGLYENANELLDAAVEMFGARLTIWRSPWRLGVAHAFNFGVALARNEWSFMLGADDDLYPEAVEAITNAIAALPEKSALRSFVYVYIRYDPAERAPLGADQCLPCNTAAVSKTLWRATGGFPIETAIGCPDSAFHEMFAHRPDVCRFVECSTAGPLVRVRLHDDQETEYRRKSPWMHYAFEAKRVLADTWTPPTWGRYE